ncbi:MAG: PAS domain-containing protein [bacterium]
MSEGNHENLLKKVELLENENSKLKTKLSAKEEEIEQLKKAKNYLDNVLDNMPGLVYWKDKNGVILGDNEAHAKALGFSKPEDVIGKTDYDFSWKNQADEIHKNDLIAIRDGKTIIVEEEGVLPNGNKIVGLTHKSPLKDEKGKIIGLIGISIDITARKEAEKKAAQLQLENEHQKTELEAQTKFKRLIDQAAHDTKSPLAILLIIAHQCNGLKKEDLFKTLENYTAFLPMNVYWIR